MRRASNGTRLERPLREEDVQRGRSVSEMAQEVLMRQAKALAHGSGCSLEEGPSLAGKRVLGW
jgi:hypothetical protein